MHARISALVVAVSMLPACSGDGGGGGNADGGGGSGGGSFQAAPPPADVCSLLSLADVQAFFPAAVASEAQPINDPVPDIWTRTCSWYGKPSGKSLDAADLVVYGAATAQGVQGLMVLAGGMGTSKTPVSGIGEQATYWEQGTSNVGLVARQGSYAVDVTVYMTTPFPTQAQLEGPVKNVLGEL